MKRWICWGVVTGCGVSALFAGTGAWNVNSDGVTVSGALTVAGGGTVTARLPDPPGTGWAGRVAVMTFGSLTGASNLSPWTVSGLPPGYTGGLSVEDQTVYLEIRAKGTLMVVH